MSVFIDVSRRVRELLPKDRDDYSYTSYFQPVFDSLSEEEQVLYELESETALKTFHRQCPLEEFVDQIEADLMGEDYPKKDVQ